MKILTKKKQERLTLADLRRMDFKARMAEHQMAVFSRALSNLDGNFLCFFPTGVKKDPTGGSNPVTEWLVIGNPPGDGSSSGDGGSSNGGGEFKQTRSGSFRIVCQQCGQKAQLKRRNK